MIVWATISFWRRTLSTGVRWKVLEKKRYDKYILEGSTLHTTVWETPFWSVGTPPCRFCLRCNSLHVVAVVTTKCWPRRIEKAAILFNGFSAFFYRLLIGVHTVFCVWQTCHTMSDVKVAKNRSNMITCSWNLRLTFKAEARLNNI
jgi:hypothetical protein